MASFLKRRGRIEARIRRTGYPPQRRSFTTKADAMAWATIIESEIARNVFVDRSEAERTTFSDLLHRYKKEVTSKKRSAPQESQRIDALCKDPIASIKVAGITSSIIASYRDRRALSVGPATVNRELSLILHALKVARREWGIHTENMTGMVRRLREPHGRNRVLDSEEEARLMSALTATARSAGGTFTGPQNVWIKPMVELAIETAMRRSELLALSWEHVHLDQRYVHLPDTKNGDERDVPLSQKAVKVLESLPRSINGRVFPTTKDALKKFWERACARAGLVNLHFHDLRHVAATRLAEKLPNVLELSAVTGHKDLKMLKRYYNPKASELARKLG